MKAASSSNAVSSSSSSIGSCITNSLEKKQPNQKNLLECLSVVIQPVVFNEQHGLETRYKGRHSHTTVDLRRGLVGAQDI